MLFKWLLEKKNNKIHDGNLKRARSHETNFVKVVGFDKVINQVITLN